ncbi:TATA-box-binding protein [Hepatocystis sp. ex Piliocolobus tephrosceles]|nr:TATA-box-binding protein [Hepatocystis sp. ex Piliocolobus tephrosceles]
MNTNEYDYDYDYNYNINETDLLYQCAEKSDNTNLNTILNGDNILANYDNINNINSTVNYNNKENNDLQNKLIHKNVSLVVHNIIASANLGVVIDLRFIALSIRNAEYNPTKINTLIIRLNKPKCTALIFKSGRIMLTGTKTKTDSLNGCKKIGKLIKLLTNQYIKLTNFKIENIIASANCNIPVRLEMLAHEHKEYCNYEPELFAGLVYRYKTTSKLKSVILIFVSGKIIITGCKSVNKLNIVFHDIYNVLVQYKS